MRAPKDLKGQTFGRLKPVERHQRGRQGCWLCECSCGTVVSVATANLLRGATRSCGCLRRESRLFRDIQGQRFGKLVALEKVSIPKKRGPRLHWRCQCDCGATVTVSSLNLFTGNTRSCGCIRSETAKAREQARAHPEHGRVLSYYKRNAKMRGLEWNLSALTFYSLIQKNCAFCKAPPRMRTLAGRDLVYNGLDRLDNTKGYTKDNVAPCCTVCNSAKGTLTVTEFSEWVERIYETRKEWGNAA